MPGSAALAVLALALLMGCTPRDGVSQSPPSSPPSSPAEPAPVVPGAEAEGLTDVTWRLVGFGAAAEAAPPLGEAAVTLQFTAEGVSGSAGCNRFFGSYQADAETISVGQIGSTEQACAPPLMDVERSFLSALEMARSWSLEGEGMRLYDAEGGVLLTLRRAS